jgi:Lactonase, 7-bladed beta-propeller
MSFDIVQSKDLSTNDFTNTTTAGSITIKTDANSSVGNAIATALNTALIPATTTSLGLVKVGSGLNVAASGEISISPTQLPIPVAGQGLKETAIGSYLIDNLYSITDLIKATAISPDGSSAYVGLTGNAAGSLISLIARDAKESLGLQSTVSLTSVGSSTTAIKVSLNGAWVFAGINSPAVASYPKSSLFVFSRNTVDGSLTLAGGFTRLNSDLSSSTLPSVTAIALSPDNQHAYVAFKGPDGITPYAVDPISGLTYLNTTLTYSAGVTPVDLKVTPDNTGVYAVSAGSQTIQVYTRSPATGYLNALSPVSLSVTPTCICVSPDSNFIYVGSNNGILIYQRNLQTNVLTFLGTYIAGASINAIEISLNQGTMYALDNQSSLRVSQVVNGLPSGFSAIDLSGFQGACLTQTPAGNILLAANNGAGLLERVVYNSANAPITSLVPATTSSLGGVFIGKGLAVDTAGKLSLLSDSASNVAGVGQRLLNVLSSRNSGTVYQNTDVKQISIMVSGSGLSFALGTTSSVQTMFVASGGTLNVPVGWYYSVTGTIASWFEIRT